jgi:outer membrane protein assembly factor BamB
MSPRLRSFAPAAVALAAALAATAPLRAQDWPSWRGPNHDGSAPDQKAPATFSKTDGVAWTASLPGPAAATPVIHGKHVLVSSTDAASRSLVAMALDRTSGRELWRHTVAEGDRRDERSNYAGPSPITDGTHAWFFYGQGELVAYTLDGKEAWRRNLQKDFGAFAFQWTFSASPLLHDGRLYLQVLQRNVPVGGRGRTDGPIESFVLTVDPATGKDIWRHVRPSEAQQESLEAYSTPVPVQHNGRAEFLITGGDCISGHDPVTGRELWRWGTWNPTRIGHWRLVPSPVAGAGVALACGPKGSPVFGVKLGQNGTLPDNGFTWKSEDRDLSSDVSTPLFYRGRFYVVNSDRRMLLCVEPGTGKIVWKGEFPGRSKIEASPTAADGRIYVMNHAGDVYVAGTGDTFEVLHSTPMADEGDRELRSSVAIAHGHLFIRTGKTLYSIGPKG